MVIRLTHDKVRNYLRSLYRFGALFGTIICTEYGNKFLKMYFERGKIYITSVLSVFLMKALAFQLDIKTYMGWGGGVVVVGKQCKHGGNICIYNRLR